MAQSVLPDTANKNRLILGVGSGSTHDNFELLGYDYDHRFRTFRNDLEIMSKVWKGEPVNGGSLATWPGCEGGPPILIGAWRSPRWITYAAKQAQGWTPSGRFSNLEDLEYGMKVYREQGGTNAVLANCSIDLQERPESAELAKLASTTILATIDSSAPPTILNSAVLSPPSRPSWVRRWRSASGQGPTKSPIVCLASDSRHLGLKNFGKFACPRPLNGLHFP